MTRTLLLLLALTAPVFADPPPPPAIDDAIKQSRTDHKPLVVEFYTTWCGPCKIFESTTLVDKRVQASLGSILFVRYDAEAEPGIAAAARYKVSAYPTFLTIDREGVVRRTYLSIPSDEAGVRQFLAMVRDAQSVTLDEADVRARIAANPRDPAARLLAGKWFSERGKTTDALASYDAVASVTSASAADRAEASVAGNRLRRLSQWKKQLVLEYLDRARKQPATIDDRALAIATVDSGAPPADIRGVLSTVLAARTDPSDINPILYVALAAGAKDEALAAARRVLESSTDGGLLDTLAECYYVHGDRQDALRVEDRALALSKGNPGLTANRARFDKGTGDAQEVAQLHAMTARVWQRLSHLEDEPQAAQRDDSGPGLPPEVMAEMIAARKLGESLAKQCAPSAGKAERAYAKIALDGTGKVKSSSLYLDGTASAALKTCLTKGLEAAKLPVAPMDPPTIDIAFKSSH